MTAIYTAGDRVSDMITLIGHLVEDVPVGDSLPSSWRAATHDAFIVVEGDGTVESTAAHTAQMVRVLVHAETRPEAFRILDIIDALLQLHSATGVGIAVRPGQNPLVVKDDGGADTHFLASAGFTVLAPRMKESIE